jgi:hypothetical protein
MKKCYTHTHRIVASHAYICFLLRKKKQYKTAGRKKTTQIPQHFFSYLYFIRILKFSQKKKRQALGVHGLTRRTLIQITQQEANQTEYGTDEITRPRFPARKQKPAIDFVLYHYGECRSRSGGLIKDVRTRNVASEFKTLLCPNYKRLWPNFSVTSVAKGRITQRAVGINGNSLLYASAKAWLRNSQKVGRTHL